MTDNLSSDKGGFGRPYTRPTATCQNVLKRLPGCSNCLISSQDSLVIDIPKCRRRHPACSSSCAPYFVQCFRNLAAIAARGQSQWRGIGLPQPARGSSAMACESAGRSHSVAQDNARHGFCCCCTWRTNKVRLVQVRLSSSYEQPACSMRPLAWTGLPNAASLNNELRLLNSRSLSSVQKQTHATPNNR